MMKNPEYYRAQMEALLDARLHLQEKYNQVERNKPPKLGRCLQKLLKAQFPSPLYLKGGYR